MLAVKFKLDFNQNIPLTFKLQTCLDVIIKLQLIILEMHIECHAICGNFFTIILAAPSPITMWKIVNYNPCLITDLLYCLRLRTPLCGLYCSVCRLEILNSFLFDLESVFCHIYQGKIFGGDDFSITNLPSTDHKLKSMNMF